MKAINWTANITIQLIWVLLVVFRSDLVTIVCGLVWLSWMMVLTIHYKKPLVQQAEILIIAVVGFSCDMLLWQLDWIGFQSEQIPWWLLLLWLNFCGLFELAFVWIKKFSRQWIVLLGTPLAVACYWLASWYHALTIVQPTYFSLASLLVWSLVIFWLSTLINLRRGCSTGSLT